MLGMVIISLMCGLPDGTLVLSNKPGTLVGNVALDSASKAQGYPAQYTHIGIVLEGKIYHMDFPRACIRDGFKPGEKVTYYLPPKPYTQAQVKAMVRYAKSQLGKRYSLRGYRRRDGTGGWCSPYVKDILKQAGHNLSYQDGFTPDNLLRALR